MIRVTEQRSTIGGLLLAALAWWLAPAPLLGQTPGAWMVAPVTQSSGAEMHVPFNRAISRQSKLAMTVDTRWTNSYGYRPVEVSVTSPTPTAGDHVITVRLYSGWKGWTSVEQEFEMPQGSTRATTTVAVPQYQTSGQYVWWDVWVDGIKDKDLSLSAADRINRFGANFSTPAGTTFLAVGRPTPGQPGGGSQRTLLAPNTYEFEVLLLELREFPRRWIDYECFDVVTLSWGEVQLLSQTNSAAFEAVRQWVRAGGQLWVGGIGDEYEALEELSKLLGLRTSIAAAERPNSAEAMPDAGWAAVRFRRGFREGQVVTFLDITTGASRVVRDPDEIARLQNDPNMVVSDQRFESAEDNFESRRWPRDSSEWFIEQRLGLGTVRAFREASEVSLFSRRPLPTNPNVAVNQDASGRMPRSLELALRSTARWSARHGLSPDDVNRDFADLLVPGVGLAPVTAFQVLITLFVLVIGPVNYWLLKRWRRLHLLVLTVPLAAGLMTAALFAYATVSDGFGTTVRVQSFTALDQRSGEAACWARLSYYSGLAPGSGLTMPADAAVYPIHPAWNASAYNRHLLGEREMIWAGDEAKLTRGWLRSRTPTQYLTIRSRETPHRLELAAGGGRLRATNKLDTSIEWVVVADRAGALWVGEQLEDGEMIFLNRIERPEAIRRFRELAVRNQPAPPPALSGDDSHYAIMQQRQWSRTYGGRFGYQSGEARLATSLLNEAVAELAGLAGKPALSLPAKTYLAVTATGPEVALGVRDAEEEASFHVTLGQW